MIWNIEKDLGELEKASKKRCCFKLGVARAWSVCLGWAGGGGVWQESGEMRTVKWHLGPNCEGPVSLCLLSYWNFILWGAGK